MKLDEGTTRGTGSVRLMTSVRTRLLGYADELKRFAGHNS